MQIVTTINTHCSFEKETYFNILSIFVYNVHSFGSTLRTDNKDNHEVYQGLWANIPVLPALFSNGHLLRDDSIRDVIFFNMTILTVQHSYVTLLLHISA